MKLTILSQEKAASGQLELPAQFEEPIRPDLIKRGVLTCQANARQPYGSFPGAGMRHSAELSKRRRKYRGSYGFGISRIPRKIMSRSGTRFGWVGALVPFAVGGRRAHPPKAEKIWDEKLNIKERRKAIRSALAATLSADAVQQRGHILPDQFPFGVEESLEQLTTTKQLRAVLDKLGFTPDLERATRRTRAGKGKLRGRRYVTARSVLIVVSGPCPLVKAASNLPGVDVCAVRNLNTELLAPGTHPGRLTIYTTKALAILGEERLFTNSPAPRRRKTPSARKVKAVRAPEEGIDAPAAKDALKKPTSKATKKAPAKPASKAPAKRPIKAEVSA